MPSIYLIKRGGPNVGGNPLLFPTTSTYPQRPLHSLKTETPLPLHVSQKLSLSGLRLGTSRLLATVWHEGGHPAVITDQVDSLALLSCHSSHGNAH